MSLTHTNTGKVLFHLLSLTITVTCELKIKCIKKTIIIALFCCLSYDKSTAPSTASSPQCATLCLLYQFTVSSFNLRYPFVVKIIPTRCNNCGLFFANAFTLRVSGDNATHHQEYVLYMATGKQANLVSKFVRSKVVLSVWVVWSCR